MEKNEIPRISRAEFEVMKVIWESGEQMSGTEIVERVMQTNNKWKKTTIFTLIDRLAKKGILKVEKRGKFNIYTAIVTEEEYKKEESRDILQRMFGGSIKNMLETLLNSTKVSKEEMDEIRKMLDERG